MFRNLWLTNQNSRKKTAYLIAWKVLEDTAKELEDGSLQGEEEKEEG